MPWETTDDYIRSGHGNPSDYSTCRTTNFDDRLPRGIKAIYCQRKDGKGWEVQSYLFPKSEGWTEGEAKGWFKTHNKSINKQVMEFLVRDLIKSGQLPALIVKSPYGKMINGGIVRLIIKTREYKKYIGMPIAIAEDDGKIYSIVTLNNAMTINKEQFEILIDKHNITEENVIDWAIENKEWNNKTLYGYPFKILKEFKLPINFYIPPDTVDWVDGVNIVKMNIDEINSKIIEKSSNEDLQDLHERMHKLWTLLKRIEVTEKRINTASLIVNKHILIKYMLDTRNIEHKNSDSLDDIGKTKLEKIIRQEGNEWVLYSSDGKKVLGRHKTKEDVLTQERAIEVNKVQEFNRYVPICKIDMEKQIVYGEVLVPDTFDAQGHKITIEEIEKASHWYMENSQKSRVMHKGDYIESAIIENYIVPQDLEFINPKGEKVKVTKGTWMMGTKIYNKEIWEQVKKGELTGYSIGGLGFLEEIAEGV